MKLFHLHMKELIDDSDLETELHALNEQKMIDPKTKKSKHPRSRELRLKGIPIPFTEVKVASPRGFEPLSPA